MAVEQWSLVGRLKRAVKKIKFLLDFNVNRWKLASLIGASSSKRRLSFNDRPGIRACLEDSESEGPGSARSLQRTISYPSEDDVDKKADAFIANFHKQLRIERQISLELRYYRGDSFNSAKSPWEGLILSNRAGLGLSNKPLIRARAPVLHWSFRCWVFFLFAGSFEFKIGGGEWRLLVLWKESQIFVYFHSFFFWILFGVHIFSCWCNRSPRDLFLVYRVFFFLIVFFRGFLYVKLVE